MKVKATVVFSMGSNEIMSIVYDNRVLRGCTGMGRMKAALLNSILEKPIKEFRLEAYFKSWPTRLFMVTEVEIEVFPVVKAKEGLTQSDVPYSCELYPYPYTKRQSIITFDEYSALMNAYYDKHLHSNRVIG